MKILKIASGAAQGALPSASRIEIEADLISRMSLDLGGRTLKTEVLTVGWLQELSLFLQASLPDFAWYRRSLVFGGSVFEAKQLPGSEAEIMFYDLSARERVPIRLDSEEIDDLVQALLGVVQEHSSSLAEDLRGTTSSALEEWIRRRADI